MRTLKEIIHTHTMWGPAENRIGFLTLGLCGEVGELANLVKKDWRGDEGDRRRKIEDEIADAGAYLLMICDLLGLDLEELIKRKAEEVEQRPQWQEYLKQRDSSNVQDG